MPLPLPQLFYRWADEPTPLPEWAYFFMRLGTQLAEFPGSDHRLVIGLAIPVRAFACGMVALGVALGRADRPTSANKAQLARILKLKPGTTVYVRTRDKKVKGILEGFREHLGKTYIVVRTAGQQRNSYPLDGFASRITTTDKEVRLPSRHQKGYTLDGPSGFLQCCVGKDKADDYQLDSSLDALIIGKVTTIRDEICNHSFICRMSRESQNVEGYLQEVLRMRRFCGANSSYRTQCASGLATTSKMMSSMHEPYCVIFDGATAYINNQHIWSKPHIVVLLDRTDRQFLDAVNLLNQNCSYRATEDTRFPIRIPGGVEMTIYEE
ncbi:MAG: hypothetical protein JW892_12655 [Anaerolineae bacterium]|nr:hypothetical protein [Anaerolineae bacterium]